MKIALCQLDIVWEDKEANQKRVLELVNNADLPPGSLLVLPEMFATGFSMNVESIAERENQPTVRFMQDLAENLEIIVVGGVVTVGPDGLGRNEAVAVGANGEVLGRYAKIHPFQGAESRNYGGGEEVVTLDLGDFRAALFVCYDLRFPEVFRMATQEGAQLILIIANWPEKRIHHWVTLLQARAVENQAYVAGVNRAGKDPFLRYPGRSLVVDPQGRVIAEADCGEQLLCADIEAESVESWRRAFPVLRDMRCRISMPEVVAESGAD